MFDNIPPGINRIYIYDDILDSGETAEAIGKLFGDDYDLYFVALCEKDGIDRANLDEYYDDLITGFKIDEGSWLYGYGMDDDGGFYRNLNSIKIK